MVDFQVKKVHLKSYDFPPIYFCLSDWRHEDSLSAKNMTKVGSKYLYSLVYEETLLEEDYDIGKSEFEQFATKEKLSSYEEALVMGSWDLSDFQNHECAGCEKFQQVFATKAKKACYKLIFPLVSAAEGAKSLFAVDFKQPISSSDNNYLLVGVDHRSANFQDLTTVNAGHTYEVRITAQRDKSFHREDSPCVPMKQVESSDYDQHICFDHCLVDHYKYNYNCEPISSESKIFDQNRKSDICSTKHGFLVKPGENVTEPEKEKVATYIKEVTEMCHARCRNPCQSLSYEYTLFDKNSNNENNSTTIFFILMYAKKGILTYEETPTLSFQSAVSNVGGQLGLWMGLSIVSVVQIPFYFVNQCFKHKAVIPNRRRQIVTLENA